MDRGFCYYFKKGFAAAWKSLVKGGKYLRYYAYWFASLLGRFVPVLGSLLPVTQVRRAKLVRDEDDMPVSRSFGGVETGNAVGTTLLCVFIRGLVLLGGMLAMFAVGALFGYFGYLIGRASDMRDPWILSIVFAVPFALAGLVYAVCVALWYAPMSYIIDSNTGLRATGVMSASSETMRRGGKMTCFLNVAVPYLIKAAYLAAAGGILYALGGISNETARIAVSFVWLIAALGFYILFAPVFTLTAQIADVCLFEDIALDPAAMNNRTKGLFITKCTVENTLADKGRDSNLENMFEKTGKAVTPPDTKYVPPTDWADKMHVYDPDAEAAEAARKEAGGDTPAPDTYVLPDDPAQPTEPTADAANGQSDAPNESAEQNESAQPSDNEESAQPQEQTESEVEDL